MKTVRFQPQFTAQVFGKIIHNCAPVALNQALQAAGINPDLIKAQLPAVLQAFTPALANMLTHAIVQEGGFLGAGENSSLKNDAIAVGQQMIAMSQAQRVQPAPAPVQPVAATMPGGMQNGDSPASLTDFQG